MKPSRGLLSAVLVIAAPLVVVARCSSSPSTPDGGTPDATTDAPSPDTGTPDTSMTDAPAEAEAGPTCVVPDAGTPGSLDTSFNAALITTITNNFGAGAAAVDTMGRVYVAGTASGNGCATANGSSFALVRLTSSGNLDTTFNPGNAPKCYAVDTTVGGINAAYAMAIDSMGRIVMGGISGHPTHYFASVIRVDDMGNLDTTFDGMGTLDLLGSDGGVAAGSARGFVTIYGLAIGAGDKVILSGSDDNGGSANPWQAGYIARLTSGGALDVSFATSGLYTDVSVHGYWGVTTNATDGTVTAVGYDREAPTHVVLRRLTSSGAADGSFGADGGVATVPAILDAGFNDLGRSVLQLPSGEYLAAGAAGASNETGIIGTALLHQNGAMDTTFGGAGTATAPSLTFYGFYVTNALGSICNSNLYVMGDIGSDPNEDVALTKILPNGQIDTAFGTNGLTTIAIPGNQIPTQMVQDPVTGKLIVVGTGGGLLVARINP
jgi:uncharacterized delta-60 repeat protein